MVQNYKCSDIAKWYCDVDLNCNGFSYYFNDNTTGVHIYDKKITNCENADIQPEPLLRNATTMIKNIIPPPPQPQEIKYDEADKLLCNYEPDIKNHDFIKEIENTINIKIDKVKPKWKM